MYLYRAVDREGKTVDFRLSARRNVAAAKAFFRKATRSQGSAPRTITLDGYAASHRAVREMKADGQLPEDTTLRSSKYLNNLVEQDHRGSEAADWSDARPQAVQDRGNHHRRYRIAAQDPQGPIQSGQAAPQRRKCARSLEHGVGSAIGGVLSGTCDARRAKLHQNP